MPLPEVFKERLGRIIPAALNGAVMKTFEVPRKFALRVNTLKTTPAEAAAYLTARAIPFVTVPWYPDALVLEPDARFALRGDPWIQDGRLYPQNLSSMLPPLVLGVKPGERVLDLCAAPGSKTTQMAAMMRNQGEITAVEAIRERYFKLKSVCELTGARIVNLVCCDGRRFDPSHNRSHTPPRSAFHEAVMNNPRLIPQADPRIFDRVLVDAPCSSEGLFDANDPETIGYWSERKIDEASKKQRGLLLSASRLLKPGGTLVYSTCSFAPEENEATVDWFLKKADPGFRCVPAGGDAPHLFGRPGGVPVYPALEGWGKKTFHTDARNTVRVLPGEGRIGFFIAKFVLK